HCVLPGSLFESGQARYRFDAPDQREVRGIFFVQVTDANGSRASAAVTILPGSCIGARDDLTMHFPVAWLSAEAYRFDLGYFPYDRDPSRIIWQFDLGSFGLSGDQLSENAGGASGQGEDTSETTGITVDETDLSIMLDCVTFDVHKFGFKLNFVLLPEYPEDIFWEMDMETFNEK
ncbi:MAG: hypothetical protein HQK66_14005, partial [Desulfamplus sp.]|nr:hypothetical protein [Desulfamplus sp.]